MNAEDFHACPAGPEHARALVALFERTGSRCYCRYWQFQGDKNAWLDRSAHAPEQNRHELLSSLAAVAPSGVVAETPGKTVVGWLKVGSSNELQKLYQQKPYRGLTCFEGGAAARDRVFTVGCFLVDERYRRKGVARALLRAGVELARAAGAHYLEAFPSRAASVHDSQLMLGPASLFEEFGFSEVACVGPYPVFRKSLCG